MHESNPNFLPAMATFGDLLPSRRHHVSMGLIAGAVETMRGQMATIRDQMATRSNLEAATAAIRGDIEQVHLRLEGIEHTLSSRLEQIEGDLSRLRSVVYSLS